MREYTLYGSQIHSRKDFHDQIAQVMDFPDYYGGNLDALMDTLTDIGEETLLILEEAELLEETLGSYYKVLLKVLRAAAEENDNFTYQI